MSRAAKIWIGVLVYLLVAVLLYAIFGSDGKNEEFQPQNEFKLDPWIRSTSPGSTCRSTRRCSTCSLACALTAAR